MTEQEKYLREVPLPKQTETYTVISHGHIIDIVRAELEKNGFQIEKENYTYSADGEEALAKIYIKTEKDPDMGMMFTWWNSYNKKIKFGCAVGSFIYDNNASLIGSEGMSWIRMHTGTADKEVDNILSQLIGAAGSYFDKLIAEKNRMINCPLTVEDFGCIMGALYFEHELILTTQATAIKKEYHKPVHEYEHKDTLWFLYKLLMFGIEGMDIKKWAKSQQKLHHMIMTEYAIIQQDREEEKLVDKPNADFTISHNSLVGMGDLDDLPVDDTPQIAGIPNGNGMSDTDDNEEITSGPMKTSAICDECQEVVCECEEEIIIEKKEPIASVQLTDDQIEIIKEEQGAPIKSIAHEVDPNAELIEQPVEKFKRNALEAGYAETLIDYYISDHFDEDLDVMENVRKFVDWAPDKPIADKIGLSDDVPEEKPVIETEEVSEVIVEEINEIVGGDALEAELDDIFAEKPVVEEPAEESVKEEKKEEKKSIEPVANLDKKVEIISPEEAKEKASDTFEFPTDLDNPEKLAKEVATEKNEEAEDIFEIEEHEGLDVPDEVRAQAALIEKRMKLLYGEVRPYVVQETDTQVNVTIEETLESFYVKI